MTLDPLVLLTVLLVFGVAGFVTWRWGWKAGLGVFAGLGALAAALFRRNTPSALTPPPPPPAGAATVVAEAAKAEVEAAATTERAAIAKAAEDPDALAAAMRAQR